MQFNCSILRFISSNLSLVFKFSKPSSSLFVHFFLQVLSLDSIFLIHLLQYIKLMGFSGKSLFSSSCFIFSILLSNSCFHLLSLVVFKPIILSFFLLLQQDIFFSRLINVFEQIYSCLVFSLPLSISHFELSFSLLSNLFINCPFKSCFIVRRLLIICLKLNNFFSSLNLSSLFKINHSLFSG